MRAWTRESFLERVSVCGPDECWLWTGKVAPNEYGQCASRLLQVSGSHCLAFALFIGLIPDGQCVCHRCDVKLCCNPRHLFLGSHLVNNRDSVNKGRNSRGAAHSQALAERDFRGELVPTHVLSETFVRAYRRGEIKGSDRGVAARLGVNPETIRQMRIGNTWRHVT